ncbi:MAG: bifunctional aldolase/short-chain dehydrogenase [Gammaproteobacteria bacterium]|nr:MAG: bifunctional aldolase/short-chain dehydrogenase [Gammaproteobacteria bacterium]RKZ73739.1 MAG: bifunctional aldolase/short-chain dehydrogenase [Gammaproteobacteria bacterium]
MKNLWNDNEAAKCQNEVLALRVYSSRLLGEETNLVLHGGGNTSVKMNTTNLFGETETLLYVKGSGWDLATIEAAGFAPVKLEVLKKMAQLSQLSDSEMVRVQRSAMTDPNAPNPSVEAILHAIIPFKYVEHTHADSVVTITNTEMGEKRIRQIYGNRVLIVPYVMPGFILAKKIDEMTQGIDWTALDGIILMNHGLFTFSDDAKSSYERMIQLVTDAENYLQAQGATIMISSVESKEDLLMLASIRQKVCETKGAAMIAIKDTASESVHFANRSDVASIATRGPLTPDHVIRTKAIPVILGENPTKDIANYAQAYCEYFERNTDGHLQQLNPTPCWAVLPGLGLISFARSVKEANIISDIKDHTIQAIQVAEKLGGWKALPENDIFDMEYWELEQAKLGKSHSALPLQGKIALVTGAASGIGRACVEALINQGAAVAALDLNPAITTLFNQQEILGLVCDMTVDESIQKAVENTIRHFGGLDILVSNAGTFPGSETIAEMNPQTWDSSIAINLTSHQRLLQTCIPYLAVGMDAAVIMIASKNVPAPGPGASAYSVAKAGQTQLARVAALELGTIGIRVNMIHPNAVFDTGIWSDEVLEKRAKHYGKSVEEYKTNNLLRTEVSSKNVAALVCAMAGPIFAKTTGAQVPLDGGNERVI